MKKSIITLVIAGLFSVPVMAKKPEWADKGKPTKEQLEAHKDSMKAKGDIDDVEVRSKEHKEKAKEKHQGNKNKKDKVDSHDDRDNKDHKTKKGEKVDRDQDEGTLKGLEKQREKKAEQVQKETDKGSDKGQESRETREKWWKFWGE